jgi:hypothetical protein
MSCAAAGVAAAGGVFLSYRRRVNHPAGCAAVCVLVSTQVHLPVLCRRAGGSMCPRAQHAMDRRIACGTLSFYRGLYMLIMLRTRCVSIKSGLFIV